MSLAISALKATVKGQVQRVGFRRYALGQAQELSVSGYAKNLPDGSVEVFFQGEIERIEEFLKRLKSPPPLTHIRDVELEEAGEKPELDTFKIEYGSLEEELHEGFGALQSAFLDYWKEFKDYRSEFIDYRKELREFFERTDKNFQSIMERYGEISDKLTTILETLVRESKETRERLDKTIELLVKAVEKISSR
ncbi:MAG: acylphosphatase [archaeon]|nr:acylphosphatase [archaeon]